MTAPRKTSRSRQDPAEEILLREMHAELHELLERCGYSTGEYLRPPRAFTPSDDSDTAHFLKPKGPGALELIPAARILQLWHCEAKFLSDGGEPLPLPLSGEISITTLTAVTGCTVSARIVRDTLIEAGFAEKQGDFTRPTSRSVIGKGEDAIKQILYSMRDMTATLNYNLGVQDAAARRFQRFVFDTKVPHSRMEEFSKFFEAQALQFLYMVEEWMLNAERGAQPGEALQAINVHLFTALLDAAAESSRITPERTLVKKRNARRADAKAARKNRAKFPRATKAQS